jgi:hypothetical protein
MTRPKRPKDTNQLAHMIAGLATGHIQEETPQSDKNPHAVELGRLGGLKGGKARAKKLKKHERIAIAKKAAEKRWNKKK